jgi:glycosyltransferase involved in cell wall biosynthesis
MKPKLCYLLPKYDLNTEEHFYHNYQFLEELAKEVEVFLFIERCIGEPEFKNIPWVYKQRFIRFIPFRMIEIALLMTYLRIKGVERFYVHYSYFGALVGSLLCKLTGGKLYYWHCVSVIYKTRWRFNIQDLLHKIKAELPLKLTLKMVDHLVTGTPSLGDFYHQTFRISKRKIITLPNEIDLNRFNPRNYDRKQMRERLSLGENERIVLFIHRIAERKGAHHIPEIVRRVGKAIPDVKFIIAGDGPYFETLGKRVSDDRLDSRVRLLGWIPNRKIMELYAAADVFMMPSEEEGFPRVLLESMAMGLPFVATDIGGVREVCSENQNNFIVPVKDNLLFAQKIIELLQSQLIHEALKNEGLSHVQRFSSERVKERFLGEIMEKGE